MKIDLDKGSLIIGRALDILFLEKPVRTALGLFLGILLQGIGIVFQGIYENLAPIMEKLRVWHFMSTGLISVNIKRFSRFMSDKAELSEEMEKFLAVGKALEATGKYSKSEIKMYYQAGMQKMIDQMAVVIPDMEQSSKARAPKPSEA